MFRYKKVNDKFSVYSYSLLIMGLKKKKESFIFEILITKKIMFYKWFIFQISFNRCFIILIIKEYCINYEKLLILEELSRITNSLG